MAIILYIENKPQSKLPSYSPEKLILPPPKIPSTQK